MQWEIEAPAREQQHQPVAMWGRDRAAVLALSHRAAEVDRQLQLSDSSCMAPLYLRRVCEALTVPVFPRAPPAVLARMNDSASVIFACLLSLSPVANVVVISDQRCAHFRLMDAELLPLGRQEGELATDGRDRWAQDGDGDFGSRSTALLPSFSLRSMLVAEGIDISTVSCSTCFDASSSRLLFIVSKNGVFADESDTVIIFEAAVPTGATAVEAAAAVTATFTRVASFTRPVPSTAIATVYAGRIFVGFMTQHQRVYELQRCGETAPSDKIDEGGVEEETHTPVIAVPHTHTLRVVGEAPFTFTAVSLVVAEHGAVLAVVEQQESRVLLFSVTPVGDSGCGVGSTTALFRPPLSLCAMRPNGEPFVSIFDCTLVGRHAILVSSSSDVHVVDVRTNTQVTSLRKAFATVGEELLPSLLPPQLLDTFTDAPVFIAVHGRRVLLGLPMLLDPSRCFGGARAGVSATLVDLPFMVSE